MQLVFSKQTNFYRASYDRLFQTGIILFSVQWQLKILSDLNSSVRKVLEFMCKKVQELCEKWVTQEMFLFLDLLLGDSEQLGILWELLG